MNEKGFKEWLKSKDIKSKVASDYLSRLRRIEREIDCDIDEQYQKDNCEYLLNLFLHMGNNDEMKKYPSANFPIGKYYMGTYRLVLKKYVQFCDELKKH